MFHDKFEMKQVAENVITIGLAYWWIKHRLWHKSNLLFIETTNE